MGDRHVGDPISRCMCDAARWCPVHPDPICADCHQQPAHCDCQEAPC